MTYIASYDLYDLYLILQLTSVLFWKLQSNSTLTELKKCDIWNFEWQYFALPSEVTQTVELLVGTLQSVLRCMNHSVPTTRSSEGRIIELSNSPSWRCELPVACVKCSCSIATSSNRPTLRHALTPLEPCSHKTERTLQSQNRTKNRFCTLKNPNVVLFHVAFPKRFINLERSWKCSETTDFKNNYIHQSYIPFY